MSMRVGSTTLNISSFSFVNKKSCVKMCGRSARLGGDLGSES